MKYLVIDTETTGLHYDAQVKVISMRVNAQALYWHDGHTGADSLIKIKQYMLDPSYTKVGHNIAFDVRVLHHSGFDIVGPYIDTMSLALLYDTTNADYEAGRGLDLGSLAKRYCPEVEKVVEPIKQWQSKHKLSKQAKHDFSILPPDMVKLRCETDTKITELLFNHFMCSGYIEPKLIETEGALVDICAQAYSRGIHIHGKKLDELQHLYWASMQAVLEVIHKEGLPDISIPANKTRYRGIVDAKYNLQAYLPRSKTDKIAWEQSALLPLAYAGNTPIRLWLLYGKFEKLHSFCVQMQDLTVGNNTDRVHPSFVSAGALTGRFACRSPNLQQIPKNFNTLLDLTKLNVSLDIDPTALNFRQCIGPDKDHYWYVFDKRQIEYRIQGHYAEDANFLQAAQALDMYQPMADIAGVSRSFIKTFLLAMAYGGNTLKLALRFGMPPAKLQELIDTLTSHFPRYMSFINGAYNYEVVHTAFGRKILLQNPKDYVNYLCQSTAADEIKMCMVDIAHRCLPGTIIATIHDEIIIEVHKTQHSSELFNTYYEAVNCAHFNCKSQLFADSVLIPPNGSWATH